MTKNSAKDEISRWAEIVFSTGNENSEIIISHPEEYKKIFSEDISQNLYDDLKKLENLVVSPAELGEFFSKLSMSERSIWQEYVSTIPIKLKLLNLLIRPYREFCRTCLITHAEIEKLASWDYENFCLQQNQVYATPFRYVSEKTRRFFLELNYLIPAQLKKAGFEIIRTEEVEGIDDKMILKIARAVHSRYLHEIRKQSFPGEKDIITFPGKAGIVSQNQKEIPDFDNLSDDIKYSNIDNAYHIPTKLLAVGYRARQVKKGHKPFALLLSEKEIETMANIEHLRWSWDKRLNGWTCGKTKDNQKKIHPALVPYEELPESEKEKDRELVRLIPAILQDINYEACPVNPNRIRKLSYAIKPQSSINRILEETRDLNYQIRGMVTIPPEVEKMVGIRNKKIEEAINEIEGSYRYARHIQETFLPDDLYVRECFPDSFILYIPKDIVSGDFYYFNKRDNLIIFAAADCTGHGIPGALLSTIGYGTLDQAVNEIKLSEPHEILKHLYSRVHRFLRHEAAGSGMPDDMDIVLCSLDIQTNLLTWSGVGNPLYRITGGEIIEYKATNMLKPGKVTGECPFTSQEIPLNTGDLIYLCSDGFADQFGGTEHKKYQTSRFKNLLLGINNKSLPEQSDILYEEIENWREEKKEDQTDDILVIGIKI